ncbi:alpha/beta hydrolase [Thermostichus vulcanus]|uniref:Alpha/beta hydrolase n=1 Tax=Thermostichus vulcanus str. 'Rupite' TaxID=2813851 RepID=A0ABT0CBN6_THEVL|nr:alpha/beta hydrolase [Thermostichus vulcanus]MCJ2543198.1 alpha/beta hydrolase [Thermostichus vulcanus str. 'Rupite']
MVSRPWLRQLVWGSFSWVRVGRSLILIGLIVYGYLIWLGWFQSERMIFLPRPASYQDGEQILKLTTSDGLLISAIYLPNPAASYTLLYSHGNAEDLGDILPRLFSLQRQGFSILAYDYRGYGTSQGEPSEAGAYKDIEAAYDYLIAQGIPPAQILVYGRSVGGGPSVYLAAQKPVGGVILESTFVTAFRVLTRIPLLPFDRFDNLSRIPTIDCPLLILHGTDDGLIPFWHAQTLYKAARDPKRLVPIEGANHNNLLQVAGDRYYSILHQFVEELVDP